MDDRLHARRTIDFVAGQLAYHPSLGRLAPRYRRVVAGVSLHLTRKQIGLVLGLEPETVDTYCKVAAATLETGMTTIKQMVVEYLMQAAA